MTVVRCPVCGKPFDLQQSEAAPFCSSRCRLIDLGRWLDEQRGLPIDPDDDEEPF
jgi:uncharacterized protein